jgi:hypothetical protein
MTGLVLQMRRHALVPLMTIGMPMCIAVCCWEQDYVQIIVLEACWVMMLVFPVACRPSCIADTNVRLHS